MYYEASEVVDDIMTGAIMTPGDKQHQISRGDNYNKFYLLLPACDYDYCRVPGTRQLPPLEEGEDNSNFAPKKLRKIQIDR